MKIKQVEELVGISKKNIRFYEEQGLLNIDRAENGYREYRLCDVERLKEIKLLRKLGIPIEEIKSVLDNEESLSFCLEKQISRINRQKENLSKIKIVCEKIISNHIIDIDEFLEEIDKIEKGGEFFMNVEKKDVRPKRRQGAIIGAIIMDIIMVFAIILISWGNSVEPIPMGIFILLLASPIIVIVGTTIALIGRLKEIEGGEEDEASKY